MHREKYWRSKIPLSLALLFLLNVFLIMAVELLVFYPHPSELDAAMLENYDPAYADVRILSMDDSSYLVAHLVQTPEDSRHLVVTKRHPFIYSRAKIIHAEPLPSDESSEQVIYVKNGIHTSEIAVTGGNMVTMRYGYGGGIREITTLYLVLGAVLEGLELLIWHLIKHGHN